MLHELVACVVVVVLSLVCLVLSFFFFNDTATTEIYTLSLHDALPISHLFLLPISRCGSAPLYILSGSRCGSTPNCILPIRSEEHTSELQSLTNLVCRLLLEKKKNKKKTKYNNHN